MSWHSLFLPTHDAEGVTRALQAALQSLGYTPFNPFGLMPGLTYPRAVRLFVAPARAGWVRVIGEADREQLPLVSRSFPCLSLGLTGTEATIEVYVDGVAQPPEKALLPCLKPGLAADTLRQALDTPVVPVETAADRLDAYREALPEALKTAKVDAGQAQKMFDRLSAGLTQRSGNSGQEAAAQELLHGSRDDWNSAGGVQIRALMHCLTVPQDWRTPEFVALRDAYQLHARMRRNPNAALYPGDAEAMAAVPDALDYTAVYAGKGTS